MPQADQLLQRRKRTLERVLLGALAAGAILLILLGAASYAALNRNAARTAAVLHAYQVQNAIGTARQLIEQSENARRGYAMTGDPLAMRSWRGAVSDLPQAMARLDALMVEPAQQRQFDDVAAHLRIIQHQHEATNALAAAGRLDQAIATYRAQRSPRLFRPLRASFAALQIEERNRIAARTAARNAGVRLFYAILTAVAAIVAGLVLLSFLLVWRYTRDLDRSRRQLRLLNDTLEEQVAERTADLSRANEEIQRFAYIVSHDLRSPLVNVMGFTAELSAATGPLAELVDRAQAEAPHIVTEDARLAAKEDLPEAIGFIRTSTQKMDRLINAILKLSREGRRVIAAEPIDIAGVADTAVAAIQQVIDSRGVSVTVDRPMPKLVSDRLAIEQILSNLIENATKYQQPGRPGEVRVSAAQQRGRVVIEVADNGRGIDPRDHQRVFDLFRRSGRQDQPGEGIGLAHVRAQVYRLGGTIDVQSQLGEGATFRINLPAVYQPPQEQAA